MKTEIINQSKNIYLIPSQEPEAICSALALFYTLKELGKNVNIIIDSLPESLKFLSPSLNFISYPKNFVISVPNSVANISQVYYEKNDQALKIHLTSENGIIKKDNISFYYSETKPDLVITLGIKDYVKELSQKLDSFGFLLDSPILNIDSSPSAEGERVDNKTDNKNFGKINLIEDKPLLELVMSLINNLNKND